MKLVYAVDKQSYNDNMHDGVVKKVHGQLAQFQREGIETTVCEYEWKSGYPQIVVDADTDILYFRRIEPSVKFIRKLHELKKINKKLRIIMEIPTYPFSLKKEDYSLKKTINRVIGLRLIKHYVDRIVLIGGLVSTVYGIPVISINNGIDFNAVKVKKAIETDNANGIHMICVSSCARSHGYERVIEGLHDYYAQGDNREAVFLHLVGTGRCWDEYKYLSDKYDLTDKYLFFYGRKTGAELDPIYDKCHIGLAGLGTYRTKIILSSSLKAREYAAKGIPMVVDIMLDMDNEMTNKYILSVPSEDKPLDIQKIVEFYHRVYDGKAEQFINQEIRDVFYPYCDWEFTLVPVIDYIKSGK